MNKLVGIIVITLFISTAIPTLGFIDISSDNNFELHTKSYSLDIIWTEDFDSYSLGQLLDGTPDDGGWKTWGGYGQLGAYVVNEQSHSSPYSLEICKNSDLVYEFTDIRSGNWVFTDWIYVPSGYYQNSFILFMSYYNSNPLECYCPFSIGLWYDGENGAVYNDISDNYLTLLNDQWVKIQVEIDLEANWYKCYYNNELLIENIWTNGSHSGDFSDGFLNFAGIDLYCEYVDTPVYHDDMSLQGEKTGANPNLNCDGAIKIENISPGSKISGNFIVENIGEPNSRLEWKVSEYPNWGNYWKIQPNSGRLKPEDGQINVNVSFTAPNLTATKFNGLLKVIAVGNPDDYNEIPITITTSRNKNINNPVFEKLLLRFPILELLL